MYMYYDAYAYIMHANKLPGRRSAPILPIPFTKAVAMLLLERLCELNWMSGFRVAQLRFHGSSEDFACISL